MEEIIQRESWFKRNWKWVVPTGGCLLLVVIAVFFLLSIFYGVTSMMSDSQAYTDALKSATSNELVISRLGEPIETNGMSGGNINYSNGYGTAELTIPIKGPNGEATIRVEGGGVDENWTYDKMEVFISETNEVINLLEEQPL